MALKSLHTTASSWAVALKFLSSVTRCITVSVNWMTLLKLCGRAFAIDFRSLAVSSRSEKTSFDACA